MFHQDPNDKLDYSIDWYDQSTGRTPQFEAGESIVTSVWSANDPVILFTNDTFTATVSTVFIAGGVVNTQYIISNIVTTDKGRTFDRSFVINIREMYA
jgi:hypothetical protein